MSVQVLPGVLKRSVGDQQDVILRTMTYKCVVTMKALTYVPSISNVQEMRVLKQEEDVGRNIYIYMCTMEGEEVETKEVWLFAPPRKNCATSTQ